MHKTNRALFHDEVRILIFDDQTELLLSWPGGNLGTTHGQKLKIAIAFALAKSGRLYR
jgi:hypothetical protein